MPASLRSRAAEPSTPERRLALAALEIESALTAGRLHEALRLLNDRTRHRFTGIFRLDPPMMRNVALYDRENPQLRLCGDIPLRETYCSIALETLSPVTIRDARIEPRVADHPARDSVLSYCGVPLLAADGRAVGTLCHYDLRPRLIPVAELPLLRRVAPMVARMIADR